MRGGVTRSLRILFVDDDALVLRALLLSFSQVEGWQVLGAEGGEAAIDELERVRLDVVVTDMKMGGVGGAEVLAAAKRTNPCAARIVLTGMDVGPAVIDADLVVMKPCTADRLHASILDVLARVNPL